MTVAPGKPNTISTPSWRRLSKTICAPVRFFNVHLLSLSFSLARGYQKTFGRDEENHITKKPQDVSHGLIRIRPWVFAPHGLIAFMRSFPIPVRQWAGPPKAQGQKEA
jgi:hypothetical protein